MAHTFKNGLNVVFKPFFHAFDSFFVNSFSDKSADAFKIFVRERLLFMDKFQFIGLFCGMDKSIPYNAIQNIIVGQGLAPAAFSRDFFGRSKPLPYNNLRITYKHATNLIFRKNRSQCCLSKRRRTSVLRACAGGAEGDFNKNQLDKLEFK